MNQYLAIKGKILYPMTFLKENRAFLSPGIIDVTGENTPDEEIFGPLLLMTRVKNFYDAIQEANKSSFGLTAGIITDSQEEAKRALDELEAGIINCNTPLTGASGLAPFGGVKDSGNCRPAGYYAADFTAYPVASTVTVKPERPNKLPHGYPK